MTGLRGAAGVGAPSFMGLICACRDTRIKGFICALRFISRLLILFLAWVPASTELAL